MFKTLDNPYIDAVEIDIARRQTAPRHFRQEYEASFEDYEGLIYPEFNQDLHCIQPMVLPEHWSRVGAIDPAVTGNTGVLYAAISDDDDIYIFGEYYQQNKRVHEVASEIAGKCERWIIDSAA